MSDSGMHVPCLQLIAVLRRHSRMFSLCLLGMALLIWAVIRAGGELSAYDWQWYRVWRFVGRWTEAGFAPGLLLQGLGMTLMIAGAGFVLALFMGLGAALLRCMPWPVGRAVAMGYVAVIRNSPLLLQLFVVYFLVAPVLYLGPFGAAVLTLGLFEGAYMAEIFRAGLLGIPRSQWESGLCLGFGALSTFRLVVLPQVLRSMLPPLTSQVISLIKDTSLVSAIAVTDLTMRAQQIIAETFLVFEIWVLVAGIYLLLALCVALPAQWLERRLDV